VNATVAICTWNRAALLDATLASIERMRVPDGTSWELLVVDNASTDATASVLDRWRSRLPLRSVRESRQGCSHARNRALDEARGALLVWTDDDVQVEPDWFAAYLDAAARHPQAAFFGGPVDPLFASPPAPWFAANLDVFAAALALRADPPGGGPLLRDASHVPYCANLALRLALCRGHRFDTEVGHRGTVRMGGEEVKLVEALLAEGRHGVWVRDARVRHHIPAERTTLRFLREHYRGKGRARVLGDTAAASDRELRRKLWKSRWRLITAFGRRDERWARALKAAATAAGTLAERRRR
jgi:glycosyltransferase involved in cell wall biosynthesis